MRPRFNINGDLWDDMLDHVLLVSYDYSEVYQRWHALSRSYRPLDKTEIPFTVYGMDSEGIFQILEKLPGREPVVLELYRKKYHVKLEDKGLHAMPVAPKTPVDKPKKIIYDSSRKTTRKEYERVNGPLPPPVYNPEQPEDADQISWIYLPK